MTKNFLSGNFFSEKKKFPETVLGDLKIKICLFEIKKVKEQRRTGPEPLQCALTIKLNDGWGDPAVV